MHTEPGLALYDLRSENHGRHQPPRQDTVAGDSLHRGRAAVTGSRKFVRRTSDASTVVNHT